MAVVLFTIVFLFLRRRSSNRQGVLLVGLCDAGKSLIFSRLTYGKFFATQTSMIENVSTYEVNGEKKKTLRLIDIPGHDRVRQQYFDKFKSIARAIIYVIDSSTFQKEVKDVAELLYQILSDRTVMKNAPSLLIVCNKHDCVLAKGARVVQSALEKELNHVRMSRSASLQVTDGTSTTSVFLGRRDRDFAFDDLRTMTIEFVECFARAQKNESEHDLEPVKEWLVKVA